MLDLDANQEEVDLAHNNVTKVVPAQREGEGGGRVRERERKREREG